ncbi:MAG: plasmid pRiA4b ORF-3 family protein [bacterium]|nr:plasmid pRiA4b ORF-3 family protein [bacterium]
MGTVLQFKIELLDVSPPIWRRIEVPGDYTFWDLHVAIQDAMGWTDSHLHAFAVDNGTVEIGIPDQDGESSTVPGWQRRLNEHFADPGDNVKYEYDFGDSWLHSVILEKSRPAEPGAEDLRCLDGARKCPPEDCGGPPGFEEFLEAIGDPNHASHEHYLDWCGGAFDAEEFDSALVNFDDPAERLKGIH